MAKSFFRLFFLVIYFSFLPVISFSATHQDFKQESRDMKITGRVTRVSEGKMVVEAWPQPRRMKPKIDRIELISPSGKRYKVSDIDNFPMSQVPKKRAQYVETACAKISDWFCDTAYAEECPLEDHSNCTHPGGGKYSGGGEGSGEGVSRHDAEAFAAFGMLAGMASATEKEWVSAGTVNVQEEPGEWKALIDVVNDKNQKQTFTVPFNMTKLAAADREVTMISSTDPETGLTTTIRLNPDGSKTTTVTDRSGRVVSTTTRPPFRGSTRTFIDPKTGLRITETDNGDGSFTRRAEDENGNWSEGTRWPGGKKPPTAASTPKEEPPTSATPPVAPPATPQPEPEPETPHTQERDNPPPTQPTGPMVSILDEIEQGEEKPPTIYGEEMDGKVGILLIRDDDEWVPRYDNRTAVTAKLYVPDPTRPRVWLPSNTPRKHITARFTERSKEKGRCMNRDLPDGPQDSPDLFMKQSENLDTKCTDDPTGKGHFGACETTRDVNTWTFEISSEDFGGFSKMLASCPGCVELTPAYHEMHGRYPVGIESSSDPDLKFLRVPKDTNDNQVSDGYGPDKTQIERAHWDDEKLPAGKGVDGDGFTAYEEYRGFYDKWSTHNRTDWKKKTLFIENDSNLPGVTDYESATGLEVYQIDNTQHKDRVVNFNGGHAHEVDQHCIVLRQSAVTGNGLLGYTETDWGPPKHTQWVEIYPGNHKNVRVQDTVVHELGHAINMRHHGQTGMWEEEWYPPGTWRDYNPIGGIRIPGTDINVIARASKTPKLCGITLPETIPFGEKHNQSSGMAECYMRYEYQGLAFYQEDGTIECLGRPPAFTGFCASPTGTAFNAGDHAAGHATVGNCIGQFVINDKE